MDYPYGGIGQGGRCPQSFDTSHDHEELGEEWDQRHFPRGSYCVIYLGPSGVRKLGSLRRIPQKSLEGIFMKVSKANDKQ